MKDIPSDLITRAAGGDRGAFEKIYNETSRFVYNAALRIVRNAADADDVTQEVYIRVYRNLKGFGFRSAFTTWLYRITMNAALNACRRRDRDEKRHVHDDLVLEQAATDDRAAEAIRSVGHDPRHEEAARLLDSLTPDHRACIVLRELEGLSYEEMADALHININTVRTRLKRAREALLERTGKR